MTCKPFKRGNPGNPCCGGSCECPGGGTSRNFRGVPTLKVVVEGLPSTYGWDAVWGSGSRRWDTFSLSGLDAANGTYLMPLDVDDNNCVRFVGQVNPLSFTGKTISIGHTRRVLSGSTGCTISSTTSGTPSSQLVIRRTIFTSGVIEVELNNFYNTFIGPAQNTEYSLRAREYLHCNLDFNPALAEGEFDASGGIGTTLGGGTDRFIPHSATTIFMVHRANASGECVSPYTFSYYSLGTMRATIIDDV